MATGTRRDAVELGLGRRNDRRRRRDEERAFQEKKNHPDDVAAVIIDLTYGEARKHVNNHASNLHYRNVSKRGTPVVAPRSSWLEASWCQKVPS